MKAGLLLKPAKVEAEVNVTTTKAQFENSVLHRNGTVIDERFRQKRETTNFSSSTAVPSHPLENGGSESQSRNIPIKRKESLIYNDENQILSGSLDELISELVPRGHTSVDENYQFTFLLSSRLFLTPTQLLSEVVKRAQSLATIISRESHPTFISNLVTLLSHWMIWFPPDFMEASMIQKTKKLEALALEYYPAISAKFQHLMVTLNSHLSAIEKHEKALEKLANSSIEIEVGDNFDLKPSRMAEELTRIELEEHLCFLGPEEIVNAFAKESKSNSKSSQSSEEDELSTEARFRAAKKTKNLESYISWFNRLSFLVATNVCKVIKAINLSSLISIIDSLRIVYS